jgi:DNA polymerase-3 subunit beta
MQFTISREALLKPLHRVQGVVERRQALPILSHILVVVKNQLLSLTSTDLEIEMIVRVPLRHAAQNGVTTIPGKKLMDICKTLPEQAEIEIEAHEGKVQVRSGRSRYVVAALAADNFPKMEQSQSDTELSFKQSMLRQLLEATCFAMAQQDVRYYLNGLLMVFTPEEVAMVATDGHRLATIAFATRKNISEPLSVIVPRKAVIEMQRLFAEGDEEVGLVIGKNHLRAVTTHTSFVTKLIEGKFPDYKKVLPAQCAHRFEIPAEKLKQALLRVSALFTDKYRGVRLVFTPGLLQIIATTPDKDEVEDEIETDYQGQRVEIGANASYLIEYFNVLKTQSVTIAFTDASQAILFETTVSDGSVMVPHFYVVMPMRI